MADEAQVHLPRDAIENLRQGLVDGVESDPPADLRMHIDVDLGIAGQRKQQLAYLGIGDHHRVQGLGRPRLRRLQYRHLMHWLGNVGSCQDAAIDVTAIGALGRGRAGTKTKRQQQADRGSPDSLKQASVHDAVPVSVARAWRSNALRTASSERR